MEHHDLTQEAMPTGDGHARVYSREEEREVLRYIIDPVDIYTEQGVYWADLPLGQKVSFVNKAQNAETVAELRGIGRMAKKDPLAPVAWYFKKAVLPGAGLGLEGYVLFSIGNLTPLFQAVWPECWKTYDVCSENWTYAVQYLEIIGIIVGQILVGGLGDGISRRWGLIQDAVIMLIGLLMLTASWGTTLNGWVICYAWSLFFYGIGVGGEYPMTATAAMENSTGKGFIQGSADRLHRGRNVTMAFLMQGWGQFFNQVILIVLLFIFHHGSGNPPYSAVAAQWTYRVSFAIPAVGTLWLCYYRYFKMPLASKTLEAAKRKADVNGYDVHSLKLTFSHFGGRLTATAGAWFCNDVFFYGNKLFQSQFIKVLSPGSTSIMTGWLWNLVNVGCSLAGYYLASFLIDHKLYGRKWMQQVGFLMDFILFVVPAFHYKYYSSADGIHAFQAMYFLSSFFNQFGPNSVTFLVAAEVYPTPVRASAHGFSAAVGKLGALFAAVIYNYITIEQKFYLVPWFGLAGMFLTAVFLPDTTGLDLKESERRWQFIREGRGDEYHGVAIHPHHLSLWERMRGVAKNYNPALDHENKMDNFKQDYWEKQDQRAEEGDTSEDMDFEPAVHEYMRSQPRPRVEKKISPSNTSDEFNEKTIV